ncbi:MULTISPECIES: methyltransferase domain-containing protein [Spirulina sp. CCY15215]|uniref:methyltransferase domain-containing protein n=1 Tax=Spirulina sp. CCY15215 TaxID=2767591 RepID=UPI00195267C5|nr:methyltransferase domain-containing protein [Spirulina major]
MEQNNETTRSPFWDNRYQNQDTPWDLKQPAPAFVDLLDSSISPKSGKIAILGCGTGNDALLFAKMGFEVTGFDFAPSAIAIAKQRAQEINLKAEFLQRDIFALSEEFAGVFDYVVEHTCFCAILPEQRDRYVEVARSLLKPKGILLGIFFTHSRPGGPPFGSTPEEICSYFESAFEILSLDPLENSHPKRQGEEHFGQFRRL